MDQDTHARRRQPAISVRPLPDERARLETRATEAGMSLASYVLSAALENHVAPNAEARQPTKRATEGDAVRRQQPAISVRLLPCEREALSANAQAAGMSLSAFLISAGLGQTVKSVVDLRQIEVLAQINADQGRLGGLLKLWLSKEARFVPGNPGRHEITTLLDAIRETQDLLKTAAKALVDRV